jgi:S-adenosylmethionine-diacylglycerol 3-amino-3-carboxypropyl transferase
MFMGHFHSERTTLAKKSGIGDRLHQRLFEVLYNRSLIYNTCWEDPALDREALRIGSDDRLLVITSAGCNVLDYALCGPTHIDAVDANPRQTALLELKIAAIRHLDYSDFFALFGEGRHPRVQEVYHDALRRDLSGFATAYWDKRIQWFSRGENDSFYYYGLSGIVARMFRSYLSVRPKLRRGIQGVFSATELEQQRERYDREVAPYLWSWSFNWALSRPLTMSLLGVPHPQREEVARYHAGGISGFVRDAIDYVFRQLPAWDNRVVRK